MCLCIYDEHTMHVQTRQIIHSPEGMFTWTPCVCMYKTQSSREPMVTFRFSRNFEYFPHRHLLVPYNSHFSKEKEREETMEIERRMSIRPILAESDGDDEVNELPSDGDEDYDDEEE
eukprot:TRINITY_DN9166_c0_g3_i2.p1 TRINITY_DN9166_c0_g3~~TRINITY_DN9166_c0_g3_i2.p1  ORF type:complete len:117 (-),score=29.94 TRINITY_DN9166_c0_g3_i2:12-362(-)